MRKLLFAALIGLAAVGTADAGPFGIFGPRRGECSDSYSWTWSSTACCQPVQQCCQVQTCQTCQQGNLGWAVASNVDTGCNCGQTVGTTQANLQEWQQFQQWKLQQQHPGTPGLAPQNQPLQMPQPPQTGSAPAKIGF